MSESGSTNLSGKTALVTGASRGIGRSIALALADMGANISINYHKNEGKAATVANIAREKGSKSITVRGNVSDSTDVNRMIDETKSKLGDIDILVNNAAIGQKVSYEAITEEDWDKTIAINLKSVFLTTQSVLPMMIKSKWGRIINLSSAAAVTGGLVGPHYTASKAGIIGLTRYYAAQLVKSGITVNAIAPALIETDMVRQADLDPDSLPIGRFGKVEEVSSVVELLIGNGFMTGQLINVNGGLYF